MYSRIYLSLGVCALTIFALFSAAAATADGLREVDQSIFGMDCAPCARGIEQGLTKLPGVSSVRVSLNEGKAILTLAADSATTLEQIREVVRHNGFMPREAKALVEGRLNVEGTRTSIEAGAAGRFLIEAQEQAVRSAAAQSASTPEKLSVWVIVPENVSSPQTVQLARR